MLKSRNQYAQRIELSAHQQGIQFHVRSLCRSAEESKVTRVIKMRLTSGSRTRR
jgi:hypothetical protein